MDDFTIYVFAGEALVSAVSGGRLHEARRLDREGEGIVVKREFTTKAEMEAYTQAVKDALDFNDDFNGIYILPLAYGSPDWLHDTEHFRFLDRVAVPTYAVNILIGATTEAEYIDYYGEKGAEDIENLHRWLDKFAESVDMKKGETFYIQYAMKNCEYPDETFDSNPIFGLPCGTVDLDFFAEK